MVMVFTIGPGRSRKGPKSKPGRGPGVPKSTPNMTKTPKMNQNFPKIDAKSLKKTLLKSQHQRILNNEVYDLSKFDQT